MWLLSVPSVACPSPPTSTLRMCKLAAQPGLKSRSRIAQRWAGGYEMSSLDVAPPPEMAPMPSKRFPSPSVVETEYEVRSNGCELWPGGTIRLRARDTTLARGEGGGDSGSYLPAQHGRGLPMIHWYISQASSKLQQCWRHCASVAAAGTGSRYRTCQPSRTYGKLALVHAPWADPASTALPRTYASIVRCCG